MKKAKIFIKRKGKRIIHQEIFAPSSALSLSFSLFLLQFHLLHIHTTHTHTNQSNPLFTCFSVSHSLSLTHTPNPPSWIHSFPLPIHLLAWWCLWCNTPLPSSSPCVCEGECVCDSLWVRLGSFFASLIITLTIFIIINTD